MPTISWANYVSTAESFFLPFVIPESFIMSIKIAIVDDHPKARLHHTEILSNMGLEVVMTAWNGKDFLDQLSLSTTLPDVCLLDVNMPVMNGYQTAETLSSQWKQIRILGYSVDNDEHTRTTMFKSGAHGFVEKFGNPEELRKEILRIAALDIC